MIMIWANAPPLRLSDQISLALFGALVLGWAVRFMARGVRPSHWLVKSIGVAIAAVLAMEALVIADGRGVLAFLSGTASGYFLGRPRPAIDAPAGPTSS